MRRIPFALLAALCAASHLAALDRAGLQAAFDEAKATGKPLLAVVGDYG